MQHASFANDLDCMIAILGFDSTVEYVLRTVASHLDLESVTGHTFDIVDLASLAGSINRALKDCAGQSLPYLAEIKLLRSTRNLVQHGAVSPLRDLDRFSRITERFFNRVLELVFGFSLKELRASAVVSNTVVKEHLQKAEGALDNDQWLECVVACRDAFENAYFERVRQSHVTLSIYPAIVQAKAAKDISIWSLTTILEELELSRLGINNEDYRRFRDYLRHIPRDYQPDKQGVYVLMQRPWARDDATFCYGFVSECLLRWQAKDRPPLYMHDTDQDYKFIERIGDVYVGDKFPGGCSYSFDDNNRLILWYLTGDKMKEIDGLQDGKSYRLVTERFADGELDHRHETDIELVGKYARPITCNPERWSVVLWYREKGRGLQEDAPADAGV
jgi:hypothetical protein